MGKAAEAVAEEGKDAMEFVGDLLDNGDDETPIGVILAVIGVIVLAIGSIIGVCKLCKKK